MKKPLSITSPTHAVALANYCVLGFSGLLFIMNSGSSGPKLMERARGEMISDIWGASLMLFGFAAFAAAIAAKRSKMPEHNLRVEMWACSGLAINLGFFFSVLLESAGQAALTTLFFTLTFALGALFRAVQISVEQRLLKAARLHPVKSDAVLADPRDEYGS